jgi:hypothetical protein
MDVANTNARKTRHPLDRDTGGNIPESRSEF